ncbi:hypothetical protein PO909_030649 [Leuciscus waleckii]
MSLRFDSKVTDLILCSVIYRDLQYITKLLQYIKHQAYSDAEYPVSFIATGPAQLQVSFFTSGPIQLQDFCVIDDPIQLLTPSSSINSSQFVTPSPQYNFTSSAPASVAPPSCSDPPWASQPQLRLGVWIHGSASVLRVFYSNSACQPIGSTLAPHSLCSTWDCRLFGSSRLPRISDSTLVRCRPTPSSALVPSSIDYAVGHPHPGSYMDRLLKKISLPHLIFLA